MGTLTGVCRAEPGESADLKALQAQVRELQAQVRSLRQVKQKEAAPATAPAVQSELSVARAVLRDADRQSRLMDLSGMSAGWNADRGFFIRSDDGKFLLSPFVLFQARYAMSIRQEARPDGGSDTQSGFEIRRLQFGIDGNVFTPDLTYRIFWQSSELTSGNLSLLMAWVQYRIHDSPWVIGGGQFKDPLDHEQLISDALQLANDRTFVDDTLAGGEAFSKGADLRYDDGGPVRAEAAFTSGFNANNSTFQQFPTNAANFGLAARGEYKLFGKWKDYEHFTSWGNSGDVLVIGAGADWTEAGHTDAVRHVVDMQYNPGPLGLYASYLGRYTAGHKAGAGGDTYDPSVRLQASYLFNRHWEGFARYDYVHFDGKEFKTAQNTSVNEFTIGANCYLHGQAAKITCDVSYLPNGTPSNDLGNDVLANANHGEVVVRAQFQLML